MRCSLNITILVSGVVCGQLVAWADSYTFTTIAVPGSSFTEPFGINNIGQIVGDSSAGAFLDSNGVFTTISVPGANAITPFGINNTGEIVGFLADNIGTGNHGFLDKNGVITSFDVGDRTTQAKGINDSGQIAGFYTLINDFQHGFVGVNGMFTTVDVPGATGAMVVGINDAGQIVGESSAGSFLDTNGVFTSINVPGAIDTTVTAINNAGQIAGYFTDTTGGHIFVDTRGVFNTFDVPGNNRSIVPQAFGINDKGQVVGRFYPGSGGLPEGFLATPIPEPSPWMLFGCGLAAVGAVIGRRRLIRASRG